MSEQMEDDHQQKEFFDVAISYRSVHGDLAIRIYEELVGCGLNVFIYTKRQDQVVGTSGVESFYEVFRYKSRLNLVIFDESWGKPGSYTALEKEAIIESAMENGWRGLIVIVMDNTAPPKWLPADHLWYSYTEYGFDQIIGVIKARLRDLGLTVKPKTQIDHALVIEERMKFEKKRNQMINNPNNYTIAFNEQMQVIFEYISKHVTEINNRICDFKIDYKQDSDHCCISIFINDGKRLSVTINKEDFSYLPPYILLKILSLIDQRPYGGANIIARYAFKIDLTRDSGLCWNNTAEDRYFSSDQIGEFAIKTLLDMLDNQTIRCD